MITLGAGSLLAERFELEAAAGSGGMGTVFRARDLRTADRVALKLQHPGDGDHREPDRFLREAQVLSELRHPGIVSYVTHGRLPDGRVYLVMEWLDGEDLSRRLARGPLSLSEGIRLLRQAAEALDVAHRRGIVHRDVKPSNLFLRDGALDRVTVLDFGIARIARASQAMTRAGHIVGTPEYMAPEQVRGELDVDTAADVFSLGCVLYECLTGRPPFVAEHVAAVLVRILMEEPPPLSALIPGAPAPVEAMLRRMMAKDRSERPQSAGALLAELDALGPLPSDARPPALTDTLSAETRLFADGDQVLFTVVIATSLQRARAGASTLPDTAAQPDLRAALRAELSRLGARVEWLLDGTLVVTPAQTSAVTDQAAHAARCALVIKRRWPEADVALATGRGRVTAQLPVGEVVDRAAGILRACGGAPRPADGARSGVWVDELSAKLLERHFVVMAPPEGSLLLVEEASVDETRPLLGKPTPCVGREHELAILDALLSGGVEESQAHAVLVTAPAGVGKSRLRHEFVRRVLAKGSPVGVIVGRGELITAGSPYGILSHALRQLCGILGGEPPDAQRRRLEARLGQGVPASERRRVCEFLGELCNTPFPDDDSIPLRAARNDPKIMNDGISEAFLDFLRAECAGGPVLLILEDLHWGDALSVKLIDRSLRELAELPLMVLCLARPEVHDLFPRLWQGSNFKEISLGNLGKKAGERLIQHVLGAALPPDVIARMLDHAAGNALFLEELIRAAAEGKGAAVPDTVMAMLQARLSRLEPWTRRVLLAASVFGRTFYRQGAAALLGKETSAVELQRALDRLMDAEFIKQHRAGGPQPEIEYGFRHALVREAAYDLLSAEDRAAGHRAAARYLESAGETDAAVIAEHFQRSGDRASALPYYVQAATQCYERCDLAAMHRWSEQALAAGASGEVLGGIRVVEAIAAHMVADYPRGFRHGKEAFDLLPPGSAGWYKSLQVLFTLSSQAGEMGLFAELMQRFDAVEPLPAAEAQATFVETTAVLICMLSIIGVREPVARMFERARRIDAETLKRIPSAHGMFHLATTIYMEYIEPDPFGQMSAAARASHALRQAGAVRELVMSEVMLAYAEARLGATAESLDSARRASECAVKIQESMPPMLALQAQAFTRSRSDDPGLLEEGREHAVAALECAKAIPFYAGMTKSTLGRILLKLGRCAEAEAACREALVDLEGLHMLRLGALTTLVEVLLKQGDAAEALARAEEGLRAVSSAGSAGGYEVPARLAVAEARHAAGDTEGARAALRDTLEQIRIRADKIEDAAARERYLNSVHENVRARELARAWGGAC